MLLLQSSTCLYTIYMCFYSPENILSFYVYMHKLFLQKKVMCHLLMALKIHIIGLYMYV